MLDWISFLRRIVVTVVSVVVTVVDTFKLIVTFVFVSFFEGCSGWVPLPVPLPVPLVALIPPYFSSLSSSSLSSSSSSFLPPLPSSFCFKCPGLFFFVNDYELGLYNLLVFVLDCNELGASVELESSECALLYLSRKVVLLPWAVALAELTASWLMISSTMRYWSSSSTSCYSFFSLKCSMPTPDSIRSIIEGIDDTCFFSAKESKYWPRRPLSSPP